jgi:hypothetical protein
MLENKVVRVRTEAQERKESFIQMIFWATCCVYLVHILMGCGGSTGWRVSFGVSPVTAINDQATLVKETKKSPGVAQ